VGCTVGAPTIAGSVALQVHGATTAVAGAKNLGKVLSELYSVVFASSSTSGAGNNLGNLGTQSTGGGNQGSQQSGQGGTNNPRLPVNNGSWQGTPGNSGWQSTLPEVNNVTGGRPIPFRNNYPDFSRWSRGEVKLSNMKGTNSDFYTADKLFAQQQGWLKSNGKLDIARATQYRQNNQLTWHHVEDMQTMQLVPRVLNDVPHAGGASLVR
jgi:hypothetical protein